MASTRSRENGKEVGRVSRNNWLSLILLVLLASTTGVCADIPLGMGEALLTLHNKHQDNLTVGIKIDICYQCSVTPLNSLEENTSFTIPPNTNRSYIIPTAHRSSIFLNYTSGRAYCYMHTPFSYAEHGRYMMRIPSEKPAANNCTITEPADGGQNEYLPILYAAVALTALAVLWVCLVYGYRLIVSRKLLKYCHWRAVDRAAARDLGRPNPSRPSSNDYGATEGEQQPLIKGTLGTAALINNGTREVGSVGGANDIPTPKKVRLMSLDTFRGFSLAIMIFVNYGGGGYWFFAHSSWNGLTVADLVFPWFIWIMGVSLVFSFKGRSQDSAWRQLYQIVRRTVILFGLGLFINSSASDFRLETWRIPGVLQRFSIAYFVTAMTEFWSLKVYALQKRKIEFTCWEPLSDLANNWIQWLTILTLEFISLMLTFLLSSDTCPRGYLGPGGISEWGAYKNCTGGAAGIIDHWFFGEGHIYPHPTPMELYKLDHGFDPEGVLGALNTIVSCLLGVQAGRVLLWFKGRHIGIIVRLLIWGVLLGVLGALLCEGQQNNGIIPINKNLWSLSYTLAMAGSGFILLALFYTLIDVVKLWNGAPFKYPGMNSILVYVSHEVFQDYFPFAWPNQEESHLLYLSANLVGTGLWLLIAYYCYYIQFFVKI